MSDENVVDTDGIEFFAEDGADDLSVYERGVSLHRCTLPTPISTYKKRVCDSCEEKYCQDYQEVSLTQIAVFPLNPDFTCRGDHIKILGLWLP